MKPQASTTCTPPASPRSSPTLNWENPEVRQAVYPMMNWWLDQGGRFRMDVINPISKV
jgi:glycosidase